MSSDKFFEFMGGVGKIVSLFTAMGGLASIFVGNRILAYVLIFVTFLLVELWLAGILRGSEDGEQRGAAKLALIVIVIAALGGIVWWLSTIASRTSVQVFSASDPFASTGVNVSVGDQLKILVPGQDSGWNCGRKEKDGKKFDKVSPDGYPGERYSDLVYLQADACSLIGSVSSTQPGVYFAVGYQVTYIAETTGALYLGCNDSIGRFGDNPTDSYLDVSVVVVRWSNLIPIGLTLVILIAGIIVLRLKPRQ